MSVTTVTSSTIPTTFKLHGPRFRKKVAIFDFDHTIVKPKDHRPFPKDIHDWQLLTPKIPEYIRKAYTNGYMICVCTQQSKPWKIDQIKEVLIPMNIPMWVSVATHKDIYKPNTAIFDAIIGNKKWDREKSYAIGDALGRKNDWSDCDKEFAIALNVSYMSPEDYFEINTNKKQNKQKYQHEIEPVFTPITGSNGEFVIMTGYPGSGKSTYVNQVYGANSNYVILHGIDYKNVAKIIAAATPHIKEGKSIVIDSTNPSKKKRAIYIDFAKSANLAPKCVYMSTSFEDSYERNKQRPEATQVPLIAFNIYKKNFEMPSIDEGCSVLIV